MHFNSTTLLGHLTQNPELRETGTGKSVCKFGLAVNESFVDSDGKKQENVMFIDVESWGKTAENVCRYLAKGRAVLVNGRLAMQQWTDVEHGGIRRVRHLLVATSVQFLPSAT